ncbi:hypothetical protein KCU92_g10115, partial [Aureobasidium melanogenum]
TAAGIPTWSPTVVLICRSTAYVWQSGRDAQFSADCGLPLRWSIRARATSSEPMRDWNENFKTPSHCSKCES